MDTSSSRKEVQPDAEPLLCLALNRAAFLRPREKTRLAALLRSPGQLLSMSRSALQAFLGRRVLSRRWEPAALLAQAEADQGYLTGAGIGCTFYRGPGYPALLAEITDPPLVLYHRGRLPGAEAPWVAVVGTRHPTGAARRAAFELGGGLARLGAVTVSGLALGVDSAAHRGSVEAGGVTLAVLGNGIDHVYPRSGEALARRILLAGGALLSEYPPGTLPLAHQFPARNRIISGMCRTVVIVEAPARSGALITADFALQEGRELFVHADGLGGAAGRGTRALADDGAPVVRTALQLAAALGWEPRAAGGGVESPGLPGGGDGPSVGARLARQLERELAKAVLITAATPVGGRRGGAELRATSGLQRPGGRPADRGEHSAA